MKKVKLAFIENNSDRRASYRKRQKGFLKKAYELNTLCDVELATFINSPYDKEPKVFPNDEAAINIFTKFRDIPELDKSKNMVTQEKITTKRIKKIENEIEKVRKKNKKMEFTNQMYELLNGEEMPTSMHPEDLNNLSYVINQSLKQVNDAIKAKSHDEGSTSNAPQPIAGSMVSFGTSFDKPWAPLLASVGAPVSEVPLLLPSTVPSGTNFERPMAPMLVPDVTPTSMVPLTAPLMVPSNAPAQVPQFMFSMMSPLRTPPQMVPFAPSMSNLLFPPVAPQIDSLMNIPSVSGSVPMDNIVNHSFSFQKSPSLSHLMSLNDDEMMALLDDTSFDINVQDPNHPHNNL